MNENLSADQWMQLYQQTIDSSFEFSDVTTVATTSTITTTSFGGGGGGAADHLTPKACISKPIRRRSRASKRTPTTLLNADAKNFRSLVQQFTGCRRRSTSISFSNPRGPVDINFALGTENDYRGAGALHAAHANSFSQPSAVVMNNNYSPQSQLLQKQELQHQHNYQQQQQMSGSSEEQESNFSTYDSITADDYLLTSCLPIRPIGSEIPQGFLTDDLFFIS